MPKVNKIENDHVGYEIRGFQYPIYKRTDPIQQEDIEFDIPNGDLVKGQRIYNSSCAGCHDLDHDYSMGPALRTTYLRKAGSRKNFQLYASGMTSRPIYWTKRKLWEFLENPELMYPDTNMSFDGIQDPHIMASLIEYLHYLRVATVQQKSKNNII